MFFRHPPGTLLAIPVLLAALALTSCGPPTPANFHVVGAQPVASRIIPGELQGFPGLYTFAANDPSNASDMRWTVTYADAPYLTSTPVTSDDGFATVSATFVAPPTAAKRFYRTCLSSIATPSHQSCETIAVGGDTIWAGSWNVNGTPTLGFVVTQTGPAVSLQLYAVGHPSARFDMTLSSPFQGSQTMEGIEIWFEWVSNTQIEAHLPGGTFGTTDPVSLTRAA
jgi:hypothetical protein